MEDRLKILPVFSVSSWLLFSVHSVSSVSPRYLYAFFNRDGMHAARVTVRGRWRF